MRCIDIGIEVFFICEMVNFRDLFSLYKWLVCKYDLSLSENPIFLNPIFLLIILNILSISPLALLNILSSEETMASLKSCLAARSMASENPIVTKRNNLC